MAFIQDQNQIALRRQALMDAAEKNIGGAIEKYADYKQKEADKQAALDLMARKRAMELEDEQAKREFDLGKQQAEFDFKAGQEKLNRENELKKARIAAEAGVKKAELDSQTSLEKAKQQKLSQPSQSEFQAATFADRVKQAEAVLGGELGSIKTGRLESLASKWLPGEFQSPELRQVDQAERNFVNAVLRRESGAAIAPDEFASAEQQYFPRPGDTPEVISQKAQNRKIVIEGLEREAGRVRKQFPQAEQPLHQVQPQGLTRQQKIEAIRKAQGI